MASTACCNGHPSPALQGSTLLINPPSPGPCRQHSHSKTLGTADWGLLPSGGRLLVGFPAPLHRTVRIHDPTGPASNPRPATGQTCRRHAWILTGAVVWLVAVASSVTVSCLLMRYGLSQGNAPESGPGGKKQTNACVSCNPDGEQDPENGMESKSNVLCCVSDGHKMDQLIIEGVRLSLRDRLKGEELYALLNNPMFPPPINKDAAHLFFRPIKQRPTRLNAYLDQSQGDDFQTLRDWSSVGESAFVRSGIEFNSTRGHFRVKNAGIYVVYSRIVYEGADGDDDDDDDGVAGDVTSGDRTPRLLFGHSISLYQSRSSSSGGGGGGYKALLEDEQAAACHRRTVCYNSHIFSTLHLIKDSQIAVRAMQRKYVSPRTHASYFGLYKID